MVSAPENFREPGEFGEGATIVSERKSLADLAVELRSAELDYHGQRILHVKSGEYYRITGVQFRESDMSIEVTYSPQGEFYGQVRFARTVEEMDFGKRFVIG